MAIMSLDPTGRGRIRSTNRWKAALNAFEITFDGRLPQDESETNTTSVIREWRERSEPRVSVVCAVRRVGTAVSRVLRYQVVGIVDVRRSNVDRLIRRHIGDARNCPHRLGDTVSGGTRDDADRLEDPVDREPRRCYVDGYVVDRPVARRRDDPSFALSHNYYLGSLPAGRARHSGRTIKVVPGRAPHLPVSPGMATVEPSPGVFATGSGLASWARSAPTAPRSRRHAGWPCSFRSSCRTGPASATDEKMSRPGAAMSILPLW